MDTIRLYNKKTEKIHDCELYIGNVPGYVCVGPVDGEHKGYGSLEALAKDWEMEHIKKGDL